LTKKQGGSWSDQGGIFLRICFTYFTLGIEGQGRNLTRVQFSRLIPGRGDIRSDKIVFGL